MNFKISDFVSNLDIFDDYNSKTNSNNILKDFFHLDRSYLSFFDDKDTNTEYGSSETTSISVKSLNGKSKLTFQDYIKYVELLNPNIAVLPYEYVKSLCKLLVRFLQGVAKRK